MYYVYILHSKKLKKFYIGKTNNLKRRISEHKSGNSSFTSCANDWVLVYYEAFINRKDATDEELFLKTGKGRMRRENLLKNYFRNFGDK